MTGDLHPFEGVLVTDEDAALVMKACERYDAQIKTGPRALAAFSSLVATNPEEESS